MFANFLIGLREGLEASLIVSILLAHVTRLGRTDQRRWIWGGTGLAVLVAFGVGIGLELTSGELSDAAAELFAGSMGLLTVGLVTWMIFWMKRSARTISADLKSKLVPDFVMLSEAMGCVGLRCEDPSDVDATIEKAMSIDDQPVVIDFRVNRDSMVWPMVAAGTSNDDIVIAKSMTPVWDSQEL